MKKPYTHFTCVTCGLSVKTRKFTCIYAVSPSRRVYATACIKAGMLKVSSPAGCSLIYLQLRVCLPAIASILLAFLAIFACFIWVFSLEIRVFLPANCKCFVWKSRQFCMLVASKFACVSHAKLFVRYPLRSTKKT